MRRLPFVTVTLLLAVGGLASAQDPVPSPESLVDAFPARRSYSPYAGRNFPSEVFWGETHVHTGMSMDAGAFGARLKPVDAYRFARGEEVTSSTGQQVKLSRPLEFLVVADHSDNMGFFPRLNGGEPSMLADPTGRRWYDMIQAGGQQGVAAAVEIIQALTGNNFRVYPGFPTLFWGISGFFVGDLMGKALWKLVENAPRFPRRGGRVLCVHGAVSFHRASPCATRWLPGRGTMRDVELDRRVLGLQSTGEKLCSRQNRRPVQTERSIDPGKTGISGTYAIWETRI